MDVDTALRRLGKIAAGHPGLRLLVLHGSRARGEPHARSDWDLAYLADDDVDPLAVLADLSEALGSDGVDLVDLQQASGLLRFRVARDGIVVHEDPPGTHERFVLDATRFWCDAGPVIRAAQRAVLTDIG